MKLNPDCIRDILIYVESETDFTKKAIITKNTEELMNLYGIDEIFYHVRQCANGNNILLKDVTINLLFEECTIRDLSSAGHEYLANIRDLSIFEQTKKAIAEKNIQATIPIIGKVAKKIIESKLGIL